MAASAAGEALLGRHKKRFHPLSRSVRWFWYGLGLLALALFLARLPLLYCVLLVVGGAFLIASLIHPCLALLILPLVVPFGSLLDIQLGIMRVGVTELAFVWALVVWFARLCLRRDHRVAWPSLTIPFWLFLAATLFSATQSLSLQHTVKELLKWAELFLALWLALNMLNDPQRPRWLATAFIGSILLAASLAALQGIVQFVGGIGPPGFILFGRFMRAHGAFEQPNPYGGYLGLVLPLALSLALAWLSQAGGLAPSWTIIGPLSLSAAAVIALALLMTWSRGAWFGALAALVAITVPRSRAAVVAGGSIVIIAALLLFGSAGFLPPAIIERFAGLSSYVQIQDVSSIEPNPVNWAAIERLAHWQSAWDMFSENPWLGVGFGNYAAVYPVYALPYWADPLGHAHNYYLNIVAEAGLVGLSGYLLFWVAALIAVWKTARRSQGLQQAIALGALGVLAHLCVHNFFDNLYVHGMPIHIGLVLGVALWAGDGSPDGGEVVRI